ECHFINGTDQVRFLDTYIHNREQFAHFDSDVGEHVGDTPYGEKFAKNVNSQTEYMENTRAAVDWYCRHNYEVFAPFSVERRVSPSPFQSPPTHTSP
ncbi:HB2J protein, partial [Serilophus lunatus]|nr:HB2J protein [Serilophus lunatus]